MTPQDFFNTYKNAAILDSITSGVPPSFKLAQAALESSYGTSELASRYNNFFGIKGGGGVLLPTQEVINGQTQNIQDRFRVYPSPLASFADHSRFLKENPRYSDVFTTSDPFMFADLIQEAGYATDPAYSWKIKSIIMDYDLQKYDTWFRWRYVLLFLAISFGIAILILLYNLLIK